MLGRTSLGDPNGLGQDRLDGGRRAWLERRRQGSLFRLRRRFSAEAGRAGRGTIRQVRLLRKQEEGRSSRSAAGSRVRSEEHTSELQSLMRSSYAVVCLKKKNIH